MTSLLAALKKLYMSGDAQAEEMPSSWHPPMVMPNTPRNPEKDKRPPDAFLKGKSAADYGQDPFAEPVPDRTQMSKLAGAVRMPAPERAAPMSPKDMAGMSLDDPKGLVPGDMSRSDFTKETPSGVGNTPDDDVVRVTPSSYFDVGAAKSPSEPAMTLPDLPPVGPDVSDMGEQADPYEESQPAPEMNPSSNREPLRDMPGASTPQEPMVRGADDPRERLRAYLDKMHQGKGDPDRMNDLLQGNRASNSKLGLYALFNQAANMAGSINGKVASTAPIEGLVAGLQQGNNQMTGALQSAQKEQKAKADEKLKGMMFLAKQAQDEEKYRDDLSHRSKQLDELTNYHDKSLNVQDRRNELDSGYKNEMLKATQGNQQSTQHYRDDLLKLKNKEVDAKVLASKNSPAKQDPETRQYVEKMSADNAKKISGLNTVKNLREQFKKMDPRDIPAMKHFAEKMAKALQSADFGNDAITGTDAERLLGYFNFIRPGDIMSDGTSAFGQLPNAFKADIDKQIRYLEGTVADNQKEVAAIRGGAVPGQTSIKNNSTPLNYEKDTGRKPVMNPGKTIKKVQRNKVTGKMRYTYTDGTTSEE